MKKDLTKIPDFDAKTIEALITEAFRFKEVMTRGIRRETELDGRVVAMVFEKPSLRTKVAFEVATTYLGGTPVFLTSEQILASGRNEPGRESVVDIARNLERMADLIIARVYAHETITTIAETVRIPVINALCDKHHPTQALADLMVMRWHLGDTKGKTVAYVGDGNNVATSLLQICALCGINFKIATPKNYQVPTPEWRWAETQAGKTGASLSSSDDPRAAVTDADVVYTDTFVSMGQEEEKSRRIKDFQGFQVNEALLAYAKPTAIFMHCLPAHRGEEVSDAVMDGKQSVIFDQAECRLHVAKALLKHMIRV